MLIKKILQGRVFGHPLHPLVVHLPLGLWLLGLILDAASFTAAGEGWAMQGACWAMVAGTVVALLAAVTGFVDWLDMPGDHPGQNAALWHMAMMFPAILVFSVDTVLHVTRRQLATVTDVMFGLSIVGYALALVGGYLGGILIYDNGIAVGRHRRKTALPLNTIHEPRKGTTEVALAPATGLPAEYHPIVPEAVLREGETLRVEVHGTVMTLARAGGEVFAVQEFCTHRCGPLSAGTVEGKEIRCPWHNSCFALATGKVTHGPAKVDLKTFEVRVHGGIIHLKVEGEKAGAPVASAQESRSPSDRRNPQDAPDEDRAQPREKLPIRTPRES